MIVLIYASALDPCEEVPMSKILKAACWIGLFSFIAYEAVTLLFAMACKFGGHNSMEAMFGLTTPVILGLAIGVEAFLWFRQTH